MRLRVYKTEIWKAMHNRMFMTALIAGLLISAVHVGQNFILAKEYLYGQHMYTLNNGMPWGGGDIEGMSAYVNWIGADGMRLDSIVFWFLMPLLAAMPYGGAALTEKKYKYADQIFIRCGRKCEAAAKYLAAFRAGGMVVLIPVMFNFFATALFMPLTRPAVTDMSIGMDETQFGSLLYYEYPGIFILLVWLMVFLWGGTFSGMALAAGQFIKNRVFAVCFPFVICILTDMVFEMGLVVTSLEWSPVQLLHIVSFRGTDGRIIFGEIFSLMFLSFLIFRIKETAYEGI